MACNRESNIGSKINKKSGDGLVRAGGHANFVFFFVALTLINTFEQFYDVTTPNLDVMVLLPGVHGYELHLSSFERATDPSVVENGDSDPKIERKPFLPWEGLLEYDWVNKMFVIKIDPQVLLWYEGAQGWGWYLCGTVQGCRHILGFSQKQISVSQRFKNDSTRNGVKGIPEDLKSAPLPTKVRNDCGVLVANLEECTVVQDNVAWNVETKEWTPLPTELVYPFEQKLVERDEKHNVYHIVEQSKYIVYWNAKEQKWFKKSVKCCDNCKGL